MHSSPFFFFNMKKKKRMRMPAPPVVASYLHGVRRTKICSASFFSLKKKIYDGSLPNLSASA